MFFFFQAEDGIRDLVRSRGLGDVYKRQHSGLESRSPYLDPLLAEYAASIPCNLKMKGLETKYILKKALKRVLPEFVLTKKKSGFNCLLYTSDAADERSSVDLGGRRIIKKKKKKET